MFDSFYARLEVLDSQCEQNPLAGRRLGLEKESLRYDEDGVISQLDHPRVLGSSMTHPYITTDYGEALMEFVTPAFENASDTLDFLRDLHTYVYQHIGSENLWATSMPCVLDGEESVRIAEFGSSNLGKMKTVYRRGLGHRYGKTMQVIAGVHYNYSYPEHFWKRLQAQYNNPEPLQDFINTHYMGQVRNLQRYGWLLLYLFGASPAVCKSFVGDAPTQLQALDLVTLHEPYGTSLRMGDIGYRNKKDESASARADYSSVEQYVQSLREAISKPQPEYADIGAGMDDPWQQLNSNLLQIENEYYSTTRPKQITEKLEKPSTALARRGVAYVELRSLDVNPYAPNGIDENTILFVECFMLFCLLLESPAISAEERAKIDLNFMAVAHNGRDTEQCLHCADGGFRPVNQAAKALVEACASVAATLDCAESGGKYKRAVQAQMACVEDPQLTLSGRILNEMRERDESFFEFAERKSMEHRECHLKRDLPSERSEAWDKLARESLQQQAEMDAKEQVSFEQFIADYMASE
ncbi:MAG: glutamate--cysteine ligase [Granulosicoccaceae bacterium]